MFPKCLNWRDYIARSCITASFNQLPRRAQLIILPKGGQIQNRRVKPGGDDDISWMVFIQATAKSPASPQRTLSVRSAAPTPMIEVLTA